MSSLLISGDAIELLKELELYSIFGLEDILVKPYDLVVFDPDHEMGNKLECLNACYEASVDDAVILFYGVNLKPMQELMGNSKWLMRSLIRIVDQNDEQIGIIITGVKNPSVRPDLNFTLNKIQVGGKGLPDHPTAKDTKWVQPILDLYDWQYVLDPFMGSGLWGIACKERGIDYTGIELFHNYYMDARKRILEA